MGTKTLSSAGFRQEFSPQELYVLTRHWLSDISFFEIEIKYFQSRLAIYLNRPAAVHLISRADLLHRQLNDIVFMKDRLKEKMQRYQQKLEIFLDSPETVNQAVVNLEHTRLEGEYGDFIRAFRQMKQAFFTASATIAEDNTVELA